MFEEYRNAYDEMEADETVQDLRATMNNLSGELHMAEIKYRLRMSDAEEKIKEAVLNQGASVTLHDVYAKFTKGRTSTSWKKVAVACDAPQEIIDANTKLGKPSVTVSVLEENQYGKVCRLSH